MDRQDEVSYSTCPVLNKILGDSGEEGVRVMTNFTRREFDILWRSGVRRSVYNMIVNKLIAMLSSLLRNNVSW
ncbi:hypothetical protein DYB38_007063 [Aphanomyces astaci]|uniref:Uncharacterized protein n=1 Tax=Aphanomyces astaci TaxID=112090 RepID=A0A397E493_APHAT|nr:hypothetical protein DYB38_007063 [Aphanomyces astaci]